MPNEEADPPKREKNAAKSCCLAALIVGLGLFLLVFAAIAGIIIVDTINLRGEKMTLSKRVERYKAGNVKLMGFFVGQCMKQMRGQGNPQVINRILAEKLS